MKREHVGLVVLVLVQVALAATLAASAMSCTYIDEGCVPTEQNACIDCGPNGNRRWTDIEGPHNGESCDCDPGYTFASRCILDPCAPGGVGTYSEDLDGLQVLTCACSPGYVVGVPTVGEERCYPVDAGTDDAGAGGGSGGDAGSGGGGGSDDAGSGGGTGGGGGSDAGSESDAGTHRRRTTQ